MIKYFCVKSYYRYTFVELNDIAESVRIGIYSNALVFIAPPISNNDFSTILKTFQICLAEYRTYGKTKKTDFQNSKTALLDALDTLGNYVTNLAKGDTSIITLAGFKYNKYKKEKSLIIDQINTVDIKAPSLPGVLKLEIPSLGNDRNLHYFAICSEGKPIDTRAFLNGSLVLDVKHRVFMDFTKSRKKKFTGLSDKTVYYVYVFVANANGVSAFSDHIKTRVI